MPHLQSSALTKTSVQPHDDCVIVYWSKHAEDEKPNPVNAEICWFEGASREWIAFDKKTGQIKPDTVLTFGDEVEQEELSRMRSRKMYEDLMKSTTASDDPAFGEPVIADATEAPPRSNSERTPSGQDAQPGEIDAQGYDLDAPPFKEFIQSGVPWIDRNPDIVWQLGNGRYRGFRLSTGQYDFSAKPQLASVEDEDAFIRAKDWMAQLKRRATGNPNSEWDDQSVYYGQAYEHQGRQGNDLLQGLATELATTSQQHGEPSGSAAQQPELDSATAAREVDRTRPSNEAGDDRNQTGQPSSVSQQPNPATGFANPVPSRQGGQGQSLVSSSKRKASIDDAVRISSPSKRPKTTTSERLSGGDSQLRCEKSQNPKTKDENGQASVATHQQDRPAILSASVIALPSTRSDSLNPNNKRKVDEENDIEPSSPRKKTKTAITSAAFNGANAQPNTSQPPQDSTLHIGPAERAKLRKRGQADPALDASERKRVRFTEDDVQNRTIPNRSTTPADAGVQTLAAPASKTTASTSTSESVLPQSTEGRRRQAPRELIRQAKNNAIRARADAGNTMVSTGPAEAPKSPSNQVDSSHRSQPQEKKSPSRLAKPDRKERTGSPQASVQGHTSDGSNRTQRIQATPQQPQQRSMQDFMTQQTASVAQAFTRPTSDDASMMPPPVSRPRATPSVGSVRDPSMEASSEASLGRSRAPTPNTSGQPTRPAVSTAQPTLSDAMMMPPPPSVQSRATSSRPTVSSTLPTPRQPSMPPQVVQPRATPSVSSVGHTAIGATSEVSQGRAGNSSRTSVNHSSEPTLSSVQHPSRAPTSGIPEPRTRTQGPDSTHRAPAYEGTPVYATGGEQFSPHSNGAMHGYHPPNGIAHPAHYLPSQPQPSNLSWEYWPEPLLAGNTSTNYLIDHGTLWEPLQPAPAHTQPYYPATNLPSSAQPGFPNPDFLWELSQTPDPMELLFPNQLAAVMPVNGQPTVPTQPHYRRNGMPQGHPRAQVPSAAAPRRSIGGVLSSGSQENPIELE
ncbi:MAG: hypothetical protein Q9201_000570 [Fulgogasparrea decipioides]